MIDHATGLSASAITTSKKPGIISSKIFQLWISVYGLPAKFLVTAVVKLPMTTS